MRRQVSMKFIRAIVEEVTGTPNIAYLNRKRSLVYSRQMYFYMCRKFTSFSLAEIGKTLSKDHATVLHSCKNVELTIIGDPYFGVILQKIEDIVAQKHREVLSIEKRTDQLTSEGMKYIHKLEDKIDKLEMQLFVQKQKNKFHSKKFEKLNEHLEKIPQQYIDMFCETRIEPFVKMYGN